MGLLYIQKEEKEKIIFIYKYWPLFYISLLVIVGLIFVLPGRLFSSGPDTRIFLVPLIFFVGIFFAVGFWKPNRELRKAMKEGRVEITGSKFSFSKPFTAIIKK